MTGTKSLDVLYNKHSRIFSGSIVLFDEAGCPFLDFLYFVDVLLKVGVPDSWPIFKCWPYKCYVSCFSTALLAFPRFRLGPQWQGHNPCILFCLCNYFIPCIINWIRYTCDVSYFIHIFCGTLFKISIGREDLGSKNENLPLQTSFVNSVESLLGGSTTYSIVIWYSIIYFNPFSVTALDIATVPVVQS